LKWNQGPDDYGRRLSKQYAYLSPDHSQITIYYKRSLRTIPTHHIKNVFDKIPRTHLLYKHRKRKKEIEFTYVFENPVGQIPHHHSHITRQFKLLMKELGLNENYTPHSLRHGFVSYLLNSGESIYNVSKIVGHSVTQVTEFIYGHHVPDNLKNAMKKMEQLTE
jgi:integrase